MLTQFEFARSFWDFAFENPDKIGVTHVSIYMFALEHCTRLGWKEKFGLPTTMSMEAIGLKSYNTYKKHFDDLVEWGFFKVVEKSKNQHSANIICLSSASSKNNKALDRAMTKHGIKQGESTVQSTGESTSSIYILDNIVNTINLNKEKEEERKVTFPADADLLESKWAEWIDYRKKQHKFKFSSVQYEQKAINELWVKSCYRVDVAIAMIDQSIINGWKGLFEIKNNMQPQLQLNSASKYVPTEKDRD